MQNGRRRPLIYLPRYASTMAMCASIPLWQAIPWRTIYVINAGRPTDIDAYLPRSLHPMAKRQGLIPAGFFYIPNFGMSFIAGSPFSNREIVEEPAKCQRIIEEAAKYKADRISLNGVIPSAVYRHDLWPEDERFVRLQWATIFMIEQNIDQIIARHALQSNGGLPGVCVVGAGYTGAQMANRLAKKGFSVTSMDPREEAQHRLDDAVRFVGMDAREALRDVTIIVLLTSRGDDGVASVREALRPDQIILSDTHPKISRPLCRSLQSEGIQVYESALTRPGTVLLPKMPRWDRDTIPGCVAQAILEASNLSWSHDNLQHIPSDTDAQHLLMEEFFQMAETQLHARLDVATTST